MARDDHAEDGQVEDEVARLLEVAPLRGHHEGAVLLGTDPEAAPPQHLPGGDEDLLGGGGDLGLPVDRQPAQTSGGAGRLLPQGPKVLSRPGQDAPHEADHQEQVDGREEAGVVGVEDDNALLLAGLEFL